MHISGKSNSYESKESGVFHFQLHYETMTPWQWIRCCWIGLHLFSHHFKLPHHVFRKLSPISCRLGTVSCWSVGTQLQQPTHRTQVPASAEEKQIPVHLATSESESYILLHCTGTGNNLSVLMWRIDPGHRVQARQGLREDCASGLHDCSRFKLLGL